MTESPITMQMEEWSAPYGITIYGDHLSVFLSVIVAFVGFLAILFSFEYIKDRKTKYYSLLSLLFAGMLGIIHTGDLFNLFVFLEILSLASYVLVAYPKTDKSLEASIKFLITGSLGTAFLLIGIAFLYGLTGSLNMADIATRIAGSSSPAAASALALILGGLAIKAGLAPFHAWLPDAHPAAPSPVSAVLSGLVINAGLYAAIRIGFVVFSSHVLFLNILLYLGVLSMVLGGIAALMQSDLKRMLAFSSISQMGYIGMAVGLGTALGITGALFHMINQSVIKGLLFLCAGVIIYMAGTSDMTKLSGKLGSNRILSLAFLAGVLGLAGVPLFNGFGGKWLIYVAGFQVNPLLTVLSVLISVITLAYGLKAYSVIFSGNTKSRSSLSLPLSMKIPLVVLSVIIIVLGILPSIGIGLAELMANGLDSAVYVGGVLT
jgi:multicomponent Na+:H+ antiporter subunit D